MANIDFYEIGLQRKRQHGCALISVLIIAIIVTVVMVIDYYPFIGKQYKFDKEFADNQHDIKDNIQELEMKQEMDELIAWNEKHPEFDLIFAINKNKHENSAIL